MSRTRPIGERPWTAGLVYHHQKNLGLQKIVALIVGSQARLRGKVTGTEPIGVGERNDALLEAEAAAAFLPLLPTKSID
jgi:hypothetical protein